MLDGRWATPPWQDRHFWSWSLACGWVIAGPPCDTLWQLRHSSSAMPSWPGRLPADVLVGMAGQAAPPALDGMEDGRHDLDLAAARRGTGRRRWSSGCGRVPSAASRAMATRPTPGRSAWVPPAPTPALGAARSMSKAISPANPATTMSSPKISSRTTCSTRRFMTRPRPDGRWRPGARGRRRGPRGPLRGSGTCCR